MALYFISIFLFFAPTSGDLIESSKKQSLQYLHGIEQNQDQGLYLWALAMLSESNSEVKNYIRNRIRSDYADSKVLQPFLSHYENDAHLLKQLALTIGSPNLLIASLLKMDTNQLSAQKEVVHQFTNKYDLSLQDNIDYARLVEKIISKTPIETTELPLERLQLPHLLFLYDSNFKLINKAYQNQALKQAEKNFTYGSDLEHAIHLFTLFRVYYMSNELSKLYNLEQKLLADTSFPHSKLKLNIYRLLEYSMYRLGYYDRSLEISRNYSVPLTKFLKDKKAELNALILQGVFFFKIGKIEQSKEVYLDILKQAQKNNINIPRSVILTNLGVAYVKSGEFDRYLALQLKALSETENEKNYKNQLEIRKNLSIYYRNNNDTETALRYLEEALQSAKDYGNEEDLATIYISTGTFYRKLKKNYSLASEYFNKATSILDKNNRVEDYLNLLFEEGKLYVEMDSLNLALAKFEEIMSLSKSKSANQYFEALVNKTAIHLARNELQKSGELITEITSFDYNTFDFEDVIHAKTVQSSYLIKTGRQEQAYAILKPAIEQTVEWAENSTDIQSGFWNIEPEFLGAFQLTADLLIESGKNEEAVEVLDRLKTINDASLYQNPMVKSSLLNESELTQYQRLTGQLDALRKKLLVAPEKQKLSLQSTIDQLSAQKRMLDRKISRMIDQNPANITEIQRNLSGREMLMHITELNDTYYIAEIYRQEIRFKKIRLDTALRSQFTRAIKHLSVGKTDLNELNRISSALRLQEIPSRITRITLIPDSYLYQLPVDILPLSKPDHSYSYGEATYMIERFKTHYLTSLNDFDKQNTSQKQYKWDFVAYGVSEFPSRVKKKNLVPLPYAKSEVTHIVKDLTNVTDKTAYIDSSSSVAAFKSTAPKARILHLATHSKLSERDPLFSTIYMSPDTAVSSSSDFPGQIFAYELFELNLANDLIMLNSCESGSGTYLQGAGVMGISRALRYAGATSLILNLWSVNDMMASDFAIEFYKHINEGVSKDEALRQTKLHFLKTKNANPHYWGPYMLIGDREPLVRPNEETNIYVAASFMFYFILLAFASMIMDWRRKKRRVII